MCILNTNYKPKQSGKLSNQVIIAVSLCAVDLKILRQKIVFIIKCQSKINKFNKFISHIRI